MYIILKIIYNYFRHDENGDLFSKEVLIKSNKSNTPADDRSDMIQLSLLDLETQNLPAPSFGAFRVGPTVPRFVPFLNTSVLIIK